MGFAKIAPSNNIRDFGTLKIGEFFRYKDDIWIKISDLMAINISRTNDKECRKTSFGELYPCENINIELKVL